MPSSSGVTPALAITMFQPRSTTRHGNGSYAVEEPVDTSPEDGHLGIVQRRSTYAGAKPAATRSWFCSRFGTSNVAASCSTIERLGFALPVSTKLR